MGMYDTLNGEQVKCFPWFSFYVSASRLLVVLNVSARLLLILMKQQTKLSYPKVMFTFVFRKYKKNVFVFQISTFLQQ